MPQTVAYYSFVQLNPFAINNFGSVFVELEALNSKLAVEQCYYSDNWMLFLAFVIEFFMAAC